MAHWSDYVGTAAADDAAAVTSTPSLYELAEVDRTRWTILAIDLEFHGSATAATIYALDRTRHGVGSMADIEQLGWDTRQLPVRAFPVPTDRVGTLVNHALQRVSVRLLARPLRDQVLVVDGDGTPDTWD